VHKLVNYFVALVWLVNGLVCKVLGLVPRHEQIVARILDQEYAWGITKAIGTSEVLLAIWIVTGFRSRFCTITQIVLVAAMNAIEFFLVRDLLLFGGLNSLTALVFIAIVSFNEFALNKDPS
jgi:hypothetical protein